VIDNGARGLGIHGDQPCAHMAEAEVDERRQVLRQTLGQRVHAENQDAIAMAEKYEDGHVAEAAEEFA
jgi:hypothetical protein